jgi:hypothetical protein
VTLTRTRVSFRHVYQLVNFTETTLFYHDISSSEFKKASYGPAKVSVSHVPVAKPSSRKSTLVPTVASSTTAIPVFRTTGSSSTIAVTVNDVAKAKKSSKSRQPLRSGLGLRDDEAFEDESAEREAALSSPIKGADRPAIVVGHLSSSAVILIVVSCSPVSGLSTSRLCQSAQVVKR